jgi:hypothetical protein
MGQLITTSNSGLYTPIFSAFSAVVISATLLNAYYVQNNQSVISYMYIQVDIDFALGTEGEFVFSPPINTTTLNSIGVANIYTPKNNISGLCLANKIKLACNDTSVNGLIDLFVSYQYLIN